MGTPDAIKYELGLTIVALVVFWVWQTITLKRDMRKTAEDEAARQRATGVRDAGDGEDGVEQSGRTGADLSADAGGDRRPTQGR